MCCAGITGLCEGSSTPTTWRDSTSPARRGASPVLVDWDSTTPAPAEWDVAYALYRFAPVCDDVVFDFPSERGRRIRLFRDAYG